MPLPRTGHISVTTEDRIIMFVPRIRSLPSLIFFVDSVVQATNITITTPGRWTFRHENGLSYNALGPFLLPVQDMLQSLSMMSFMSLVGSPWTNAIWMICTPFSCRVSDLSC